MCSPVMVVAKGELMVVHLKMHRLRRKAWDADTSRKSCRHRQDVAGSGHFAEQDAATLCSLWSLHSAGVQQHMAKRAACSC